VGLAMEYGVEVGVGVGVGVGAGVGVGVGVGGVLGLLSHSGLMRNPPFRGQVGDPLKVSTSCLIVSPLVVLISGHIGNLFVRLFCDHSNQRMIRHRRAYTHQYYTVLSPVGSTYAMPSTCSTRCAILKQRGQARCGKRPLRRKPSMSKGPNEVAMSSACRIMCASETQALVLFCK